MSQQSLRDNQKRVEIGTHGADRHRAGAGGSREQRGARHRRRGQHQGGAGQFARAHPRSGRAGILDRDASSRPMRRAFAAQAIDVDAAVRNALDKRSDLRVGEEQPRAERHQHPVPAEPDHAGRERQGHLRHDGRRRRAAEPGRFRRDRQRACRSSRTIVSQRGFGSVLGDVLQSQYPELDVRRQHRVSARIERVAGEPGARAAAVPAGADAAEEPAAAGRHAGPRARAQRADQPAARAVGARVARAAGEEARGRGEEDGRRHGPDASSSSRRSATSRWPAPRRSRRSPTTTSRWSISRPCSSCRSAASAAASRRPARARCRSGASRDSSTGR